MTPRSNTPLLIAALLAGLLLYRHADKWRPQPAPAPQPAVVPAAELQAAVQPVKALLAGHTDAPKLAALWSAMADDFASPLCPIKTTGAVRTAQQLVGPLYFKGTKAGPPELAAAFDKFIASQLGSDDAPLDPAKAAAAFRALSWAAGGGSA